MKARKLTLLYHEVTNFPKEAGFQRKSALPYKHPVKEFISHIDLIQNSPIEVSTINEIEKYKYDDTILLTFDDGGNSAMFIADTLDKNNMKGHFFITTSMIGNKFFLNREEIEELSNRGHIIGSHSHSHPNVFKSLSKKEMIFEWNKSKKILEDLLGYQILSCSIPGGDANSNTYDSAFEQGYKFVFNSDPRINYEIIDETNYIIGRVCPKKGEDLAKVEQYIKFKGIKNELIKRKLKNNIKTIIFPLYSRIHNNNKHSDNE